MTHTPTSPPSQVAVEAVIEALDAASYTHSGVHEVLGDAAMRAMGREEFAAADRATRGGSPIETLVRLFLLGENVPLVQVRDALPFAQAWQLGLVEAVGGMGGDVRATLDLRPYAVDDRNWWVVSDLGSALRGGQSLRRDHVLGIGGASTTLAQIAPRRRVGTALDLGTGCGVQSLHLSTHAGAVTATDINPRATAIAQLTFALNGLQVEVLEGDLLQPVRDRSFDQITTNPPFVVGSGSGGYTYRDSGRAGDELTRTLVEQLPRHLTPGGSAQLLGNWMHVRGQDWRERVGAWAAASACDAWVVQRDVEDPAAYVGMWLQDAHEHDDAESRRRADQWLQWFEDHDVEGVGFGFVLLRRTESEFPVVVIDEITQPVEPPLGELVVEWFERQDLLRILGDDDILDTAWTLAPSTTLEQVAQQDPEGGWNVLGQVLRQETGLRWREDVDQMVATLLVGCDGNHRLRALLAVLETAYPLDDPVDRDNLYTATAQAARHLVTRGFLLP